MQPAERFDVVIIGTRRRRRHDGARARRHRRAHPRASSAATSCRRKTPTGIRRRCGRTCATAPPSAGSTPTARRSVPYMHYGVGGNSKFWGSVLYRLRREDFGELRHADGVSPAWPIDYDTLAPYYDRAERLYHVHGQAGDDPTEAAARSVSVSARAARAAAWQRSSTQLRAPRPAPVAAAARPRFARAKPAAASCATPATRFRAASTRRATPTCCCVRPAMAQPQRHAVDRRDGDAARHRRAAGARVEAVEVERGGGASIASRRASSIVSCGAVNSAALLLRSAGGAHPHGLANSSGLVGRRYMAHLATMMQGFHPFRKNDTVFQKTVAINDFYLTGPRRLSARADPVAGPHARDHGEDRGRHVASMLEMRHIPLWAYDAWVARGVDWLAMSEDLPRPDNRVHDRLRTAASGSRTGRTTCGARAAGGGTAADPAARSGSGRR